ncbi:hypothetical protein EV215_2033 [Hypnocyclicus thermotrophus]|uniref:Uncharacterized protein n=1 Tax=Hypnocyclicus thermotrophus TaxID=1627895 RepID=A0AA46DX03_9FUSO|nr:hypothetical protein [Hypnocyclicus thermotrophus]TDT67355.1 hypothetical protein EV215_2033 [Hypnocyclicus thermotrophus]
MKKVIMSVLLLMIVGCINYQEEKPKGELKFMINWPKKEINTNVSTNILPETKKISIYLFKYDGNNYNNSIEIKKEIIRNGESEYLITIDDLEVGNWSIDMKAYNSLDKELNFIYDDIVINEGTNAYTVFFGGPNNIYGISLDTTTNLSDFTGIEFESMGSNYSHINVDSSTYSQYDHITYTLYVSTNSDMSNAVQISEVSSTYSGEIIKFNYPIDFPSYEFTPGQKYYFKIRGENTIGYKDSNIFTISFQ